MVFFKDDSHEADTATILHALGKARLSDDVEYGTFAYVAGATGKMAQIQKAFDAEGLDVDKLYDLMGVFSSSEKGMIRFALQCFNNSIDDIPIGEVMRPLDDANKQVILQAVDMRY